MIDILSPSYPYILPSVLRLSGITLLQTSISQLVSVSSFNSTNLQISNDLAIYSFIVGFSIQSSTNDF